MEGRVVETYVPDDATFGRLKDNVSDALRIPKEFITLSFKNDHEIPDSAKLQDQGVANDDMILIILQDPRQAQQQAAPPSGGGSLVPPQLRAGGQGGSGSSLIPPQLRAQGQTAPAQGGGQVITREAAQALARQRMQLIQQNFEQAMQESPEAFASVYMLYIDVEINGHAVKAFVDSGAQTTVMSRECAERTGLINICDPRFAGVAQGVGTAKILGRVHLAPMKIGENFYNCSYSIMDSAQKVELLIGLDMLKKHHCNIDLKRDVLEIGTTGQMVKFLGESDLPDHAKLSQAAVHSLRVVSKSAFDINSYQIMTLHQQ